MDTNERFLEKTFTVINCTYNNNFTEIKCIYTRFTANKEVNTKTTTLILKTLKESLERWGGGSARVGALQAQWLEFFYRGGNSVP